MLTEGGGGVSDKIIFFNFYFIIEKIICKKLGIQTNLYTVHTGQNH